MTSDSTLKYRQRVKMRLIVLEKSQTWLIERVREETGLYFDISYLSKILKGENKNPKIIAAINEILGLPSNQDSA